MSGLYDTLREEFDKLTASLRAKLEDGRLSLSELGAIVREFLATAVVIAEQTNVPGPQKRALVIEALERFWDEELERLDMPGPDKLLDPIIRQCLPIVAGWVIDVIVDRYNDSVTGWPGTAT